MIFPERARARLVGGHELSREVVQRGAAQSLAQSVRLRELRRRRAVVGLDFLFLSFFLRLYQKTPFKRRRSVTRSATEAPAARSVATSSVGAALKAATCSAVCPAASCASSTARRAFVKEIGKQTVPLADASSRFRKRFLAGLSSFLEDTEILAQASSGTPTR